MIQKYLRSSSPAYQPLAPRYARKGGNRPGVHRPTAPTLRKPTPAPAHPSRWKRGFVGLFFVAVASALGWLLLPSPAPQKPMKPAPTPPAPKAPAASGPPDLGEGWIVMKPAVHPLPGFDSAQGDAAVIESLRAKKPLLEILASVRERLAAVQKPAVLKAGVKQHFTNSQMLQLLTVDGFPNANFLHPLDNYGSMTAQLNWSRSDVPSTIIFNPVIDGSYDMTVVSAQNGVRSRLSPRLEFLGLPSLYPTAPREPLLIISDNAHMQEGAIGVTGFDCGGLCQVNRALVAKGIQSFVAWDMPAPPATSRFWETAHAIQKQLVMDLGPQAQARLTGIKIDQVGVHEGGHRYSPDFLPNAAFAMPDPGEWSRLAFEATVGIQLSEMIANLELVQHIIDMKDPQEQQRWALLHATEALNDAVQFNREDELVRTNRLFLSCRYVPSMVLLLNTHRDATGRFTVNIDGVRQMIAPLVQEAQSTFQNIEDQAIMPAVAKFMGMTSEQTQAWIAQQIKQYQAQGLTGSDATMTFWRDLKFLLRYMTGTAGRTAISEISTQIGGEHLLELQQRVAAKLGISAKTTAEFEKQFAERVQP